MNNLFWQCQALSKIKLDWTIWKAGYNSNAGTPASGEYILKRELLESGTMTERYNTGWSIYVSDESPTSLRFTFRSAGSITLNKVGTFTSGSAEYRTDLNQDWQPYEFGNELHPLADGWVEFRGSDVISQSSSRYHQFVISGTAEASGDITSLFNKDYATYASKNYCAYQMFKNCSSLVRAPELPLAKLSKGCYQSMFENCTSLVSGPSELPVMILAEDCYRQMFYNCTVIAEAPELPATTLANNCYYRMFYSCKNITDRPELPALTLSQYCYYEMFCNTRLTKAGHLPATTLANYCYHGMFRDNPALIETATIAATEMKMGCCQGMYANSGGLSNIAVLDFSHVTKLAADCFKEIMVYVPYKEFRMPDCPYVAGAYSKICTWGSGGDIYWPYAQIPSGWFDASGYA